MPEDIVEVDAPKTKDEMRHIPHAYVDANQNNDWCAVCGRSEGWQAHAAVEDSGDSSPAILVIEGAQETPPPDEPQDALDTGPLVSAEDTAAEETI